MSTMIQIRNVPTHLHRILKVRAAQQGQSMSAYILAELERTASIPTLREVRARLQSLPALDPVPDVIALAW